MGEVKQDNVVSEPKKITAKEYLRESRYLNVQIQSLSKEREQMANVLKSTALNPNKVQETTSIHDDRYIRIIEKRDDLQSKIADKISVLIDKRNEISDIIDEMENNQAKSVYGVIIRERYINLESWQSIAEQLSYSVAHVFKLHGEALIEFNKYFNAENDIEYNSRG